MNSLFRKIQRNWEGYSERDLTYFLRAYFLLLFARFLVEYERLILEVKFNPGFQTIFWPVTDVPPIPIHKFILTATIALIPLCLVKRARPVVLLIVFPGLFWLVTVHESLYSPMLSGRYFHARLAVLYPMFATLVWDWIRLFKQMARIPEGKLDCAIPILVTQWTLGIVYLGSTAERLLRFGYPGWFDGATLQAIMLERWMAFGGDATIFVAKNYWLCLIAQQMTLVLEGGFIFSVFFPAVAPVAVAFGLLFHALTEWLMFVTYIDFTIILYSAYFHPRFFRATGELLKHLGLSMRIKLK